LALISVWELIAENQRAFQNRSLDVMKAIETELGITLEPKPKKFENDPIGRLAQWGSVRDLRLMLPAVLALAWLALYITKAVS
jgi:hypothetical protein